MEKTSAANKQLLKELNAELKVLQEKLAAAHKLEGKDAYIDVRIKSNQSRFQRIKKKGAADKAFGKFYMEISITAKQADVFVPISVASGKKTAGFMYQIEGTAESSIVTAEANVRGEGLSQIKVGTLLYSKIPTGKTGIFAIQSTIQGSFGKTYNICITRLNYKLSPSDARYQQYLKELRSDKVKFS